MLSYTEYVKYISMNRDQWYSESDTVMDEHID